MYNLSNYMYKCFLIDGLLDIYISQKGRIALFKDVLDFDLPKGEWSNDVNTNPAV